MEQRVGKFKTLWIKSVKNELTSKAKKQKAIAHARKEVVILDDSDVSKFLTGLNGDTVVLMKNCQECPTKALLVQLRNLCVIYITAFNR